MDPRFKITYIEEKVAPPMKESAFVGIRQIFYKISLFLADGRTLPITVATTDINRIEHLVNRNKVMYAARGYNVTGLKIDDIRYTLNMSEQQYQQELMFCDIIDDGQ